MNGVGKPVIATESAYWAAHSSRNRIPSAPDRISPENCWITGGGTSTWTVACRCTTSGASCPATVMETSSVKTTDGVCVSGSEMIRAVVADRHVELAGAGVVADRVAGRHRGTRRRPGPDQRRRAAGGDERRLGHQVADGELRRELRHRDRPRADLVRLPRGRGRLVDRHDGRARLGVDCQSGDHELQPVPADLPGGRRVRRQRDDPAVLGGAPAVGHLGLEARVGQSGPWRWGRRAG